MHALNVSNLNQKIFNFFQKDVTEQGTLSQFTQRKSKLGALDFFKSIITLCLSDTKITLDGIQGFLSDECINIKKQSIFERMNPKAVNFFKALFNLSLERFSASVTNTANVNDLFTHIFIIDSSTVSLPHSMKELFKGCGGNASEAAVKLQVLYEYMSQQIKELTLTQGTENDQGFDHYFTDIKENALYLMDLGYFKLESLQKISAGTAYFISRYFIGAKLFTPDNQPLDLLKTLKSAGAFYSQEVLIGSMTKIKLRLIAQRLPEEIVKERIRTLKRNYQRKGLKPTKEKLALLHWNIFVTNIKQNQLDDTEIHSTYALRWQIELLFKLSKSGMGIHIINSKKPTRVLIELYGKLICLIVLLFLCAHAKLQNNKKISLTKARHHLALRAYDFIMALSEPEKLARFTNNFLNLLICSATKETKNKKTGQSPATEIGF